MPAYNQDKFEQSSDFDANDRSYDSYSVSQSSGLGTQMSGLSIQEAQHNSPSKFNNPSTYMSSYDDRQLSGNGHYDLSATRSEFDIEEDFEEVVQAKENKSELREVMKNYQRILSGVIDES